MQPLPVAIVCVLIAATIGITAWAKRRNLDTGDHYVAGRRLTGWQNGLALTGDQISAARKAYTSENCAARFCPPTVTTSPEGRTTLFA